MDSNNMGYIWWILTWGNFYVLILTCGFKPYGFKPCGKKCICSFLCDSAVYLCGHVFTHELTILEWKQTCACANISCFTILIFSLLVKMFSDCQINEKYEKNRIHSLVFSLVSKQKYKIFWQVDIKISEQIYQNTWKQRLSWKN